MCVMWSSKATPVAIDNADLININGDFNAWRIALRPLQPPTITIAGIRSTDWSVADGATQLLVPGSLQAGTNASPILPLNVAICATQTTGRIGRSRRGRNYIPGIAENVVSTGDIIGTTFRNTIVDAYIALRNDLQADGFVNVVASFIADGVARVTALGTAITNTVVDPYSDSQRRRLAGRGA